MNTARPDAGSAVRTVLPADALRRLSPVLWPRAQILRAIVLLDLPAHLADGPRSVAELATATGADPDMLARFLRTSAVVGLITATSDGRYANNHLTSLLERENAARGYVLTVTRPSYTRPWERVADVVTTGRSAAADVLGTDLWTYREQHEDESHHFAESMTRMTVDTAEALTAHYRFDDASTIADVGGSRGTLLARVLQAVPGGTGIVFDLPGLRPEAEDELRSRGCADRARFEGGDFLRGVPGGADVYLLKNILCDWDDEHCRLILRNCFDAAPPGSRLLVIDLVRPAGPSSFLQFTDFEQAVATGGAIRTWDEYRVLLTDVGYRELSLAVLRRRDGLEHHLIEATRPPTVQ